MDYCKGEELNQELFTTSSITSKSTQRKIWVKLFQTSVKLHLEISKQYSACVDYLRFFSLSI